MTGHPSVSETIAVPAPSAVNPIQKIAGAAAAPAANAAAVLPLDPAKALSNMITAIAAAAVAAPRCWRVAKLAPANTPDKIAARGETPEPRIHGRSAASAKRGPSTWGCPHSPNA